MATPDLHDHGASDQGGAVKVIIAHNRYASGQPSGENTVVDREIADLRAAGVEVLPLLHSSDEIAGMSVVHKATLPVSPLYAGRTRRELTAMIKEHRPDVLHLHNPYPLLSPWVIRTAHAHRVPVVHTVHNYRQVCLNGVYFRDGAVCTDCRGRRLAGPGIVHACYRGSRAQSAVMATTLAAHRGTWRSVDRFIALTDAIAEHLRSYGVPAGHIVVKPNSVPDPGPPTTPGDGFAFLGRLVPEKGVGLLLDAWRRHPDGALGPLRVAGDGPLRTAVEAAANERTDIAYLGPLDGAGVRRVLADTALLVVPSVWHDVLPTVILEALAHGRGVVGTELGGIPYLIGDAGSTVRADPDALAAALPKARADAVRLGALARARWRSTFHPDVVLGQLLDVYRSLGG
jgi:glycosyltransferase involved in cell wall biosynthesis